MNQQLLGFYFLPLGVLLMGAAALWQMYVVMSESYSLNRFKEDKQRLGAAIAMFFSFSLAIYILCPNARKKGLIFLMLGIVGATLYILGKMWLPWKNA
ncbi:hypothetical protein [Neisseria sp. 83E34]|uniref:hypothetical protein n=1 Tax=Neisseria sp. 83E34 TaxID=1692264 RepID=UPI0006CE9148|nr:hypothetical protein [Neisseria sp. 83E34]KPN71029.1 membrane protein [Neisseria sp. 83E34]